MWNLPRPGIEHTSFALAGSPVATGPPGKSPYTSSVTWFRHSGWSRVAMVDVVSDKFLHHQEPVFSELCQNCGHCKPFPTQYFPAAANGNLGVSKLPPPLLNYIILLNPNQFCLTSTLSFTSSSPNSWQTIFVILHFFLTFLSLPLYSQSCRTQFKCFLNLCLPGCSPNTPKETPPYFNHVSILGILG